MIGKTNTLSFGKNPMASGVIDVGKNAKSVTVTGLNFDPNLIVLWWPLTRGHAFANDSVTIFKGEEGFFVFTHEYGSFSATITKLGFYFSSGTSGTKVTWYAYEVRS